MIEVEVKLKISDPEKIKAQLIDMGFEDSVRLKMQDVYFDNNAGQIRGSDSALRIRETMDLDSGEKVAQMNFKGPKSDWISMTRPEYEMIIESAPTGQKILESLGFFAVRPFVIKTREELKYHAMTACFDSVEGLGEFLEIEKIVESELQREDALEMIKAVLKIIGFDIKDTLTTSYLSLLQKKATDRE
jgi:adenylate cyclase class 2